VESTAPQSSILGPLQLVAGGGAIGIPGRTSLSGQLGAPIVAAAGTVESGSTAEKRRKQLVEGSLK